MKYLRDMDPLATSPIVYKVSQKIFNRLKVKHQHDFGQFINNLPSSKSTKIPGDLSLMMNAYFKYASKESASQYWNYQNTKNIDQLITNG